MKMIGKGRSDRDGRRRRLEEDLPSKEGVNKEQARRGDKPYREEIITETLDHLEFAVLGDSTLMGFFYQERECCDLSGCADSPTVPEKDIGRFFLPRI